MNTTIKIALFAAYAIISCYGLYLLKAAQSWLSPSFIIGGVLYGLGACVWMLILRTFPISIAFPIASGALMLGTSAIGIFIFKESFDIKSAMGMVFLISGIVLLSTNLDAK